GVEGSEPIQHHSRQLALEDGQRTQLSGSSQRRPTRLCRWHAGDRSRKRGEVPVRDDRLGGVESFEHVFDTSAVDTHFPGVNSACGFLQIGYVAGKVVLRMTGRAVIPTVAN